MVTQMKDNIEVVKTITRILQNHHLTGRCFDDGCTDGYDVEFVILAQDLLAEINSHYDKEE